MRVIVCGSRRWRDRQRIVYRLADLPGDTTIVVGYNPKRDTPKGAVRIAYQEAQKLGLRLETHPTWDQMGKSAGFIRNQAVAENGADLCIAFWNGRSNDTADMMTRAKNHGIPVEEITKENPGHVRGQEGEK